MDTGPQQLKIGRRIGIPLLALLLLLGWWWHRGGAAVPGRPTSVPAAQQARVVSPPVGGAPGASRLDRAQRDAMRIQILQALAAAAAQGMTAPAAGTQPAAGSQPPRPAAPPPEPRQPGMLTDRTGGHQALAAQLSRDFLPLADECIEQAQKEVPELAGSLVLGIETVADQELGAVIERAEATSRSEVLHAGLLECIRETALSLRLPRPSGKGPDSGSDKFEISLRIEPAARPKQ